MLKKILNRKNLIILILVFAALTRLIRLDYPNAYVFDEVYHGFTAKEWLAGNKEAWEWWTTPPPGVAYEWTHPPLAKEFMTASMFIVRSTDAWGWRLPGAILGIISTYLIYLLGKQIFQKETVGLLAAFIFSIDGLLFVQSRTGMNDIYVVTFVLASLLLFLKKNFYFSAIFFGLALSSKWAAIYLLGVYIILLFFSQKVSKIFYFLLIPPLVYLASYIPFFLMGHTFDQFIELQRQMWYYHSHLQATHDYASPWWSWPLNLYPVWYYVEYKNNLIGNIFASGNPFVFISGLVAIVFTGWEYYKKRTHHLLVIMLGYFAFWLPWAFSPRIMFLYHYSLSIPFLSLALGYQLSYLAKEKQKKTLLIASLGLLLLGFILFYPFFTGVLLPKNLMEFFFNTNLTKNPFGSD